MNFDAPKKPFGKKPNLTNKKKPKEEDKKIEEKIIEEKP